MNGGKMQKDEIVVFFGKKASGKTTAADHLIKNYDFTRISFADKLKHFCSEIFDIPLYWFYEPELKNVVLSLKGSGPFSGKDITPRVILQWFGTEGCRYLREDVWIYWLEKTLSEVWNNKRWVIDDCRFPNEQKMLKDRDAIFIKINRPGYEGNGHASETEQDKLVADYIIFNNGPVFQLYSQIDTIMKK